MILTFDITSYIFSAKKLPMTRKLITVGFWCNFTQ